MMRRSLVSCIILDREVSYSRRTARANKWANRSIRKEKKIRRKRIDLEHHKIVHIQILKLNRLILKLRNLKHSSYRLKQVAIRRSRSLALKYLRSLQKALLMDLRQACNRLIHTRIQSCPKQQRKTALTSRILKRCQARSFNNRKMALMFNLFRFHKPKVTTREPLRCLIRPFLARPTNIRNLTIS